MPDYQKGMIYKIVALNCEDPAEVYYGSTTQGLAKRMGSHRNDFKRWKDEKGKSYTTSSLLFEKYGLETCKIILVEKYPCNSKYELQAKEAEYILKNICINKCIPNRTYKEWCQDNAENLREQKLMYRIENIEKLKANSKQYYADNNDKIKENSKQYYVNNTDKVKTRKIQYQEENSSKIQHNQTLYRLNNADKINKKQDCNCGGKYTHKNKLMHFKTKLHQTYLLNQTEPTQQP